MRLQRGTLVALVGLLVVGWAQRPYPHLKTINPATLPKEAQKQLRSLPPRNYLPLPESEFGKSRRGGAETARTLERCDTSIFLPWLPPHIDADTIRPARRAVEQGIEDWQAGDTVLARVTSRIEDTLVTVGVCFKPYFDSLNARGSYGYSFNLLSSRDRTIVVDGQELVIYDGNALATRFEIPATAEPFRIVGLAFHLYNNFGIGFGPTRDCNLATTAEGSEGFSNQNGHYEIFAQIRRPAYDQFNEPDTVIYDRDQDGRKDTLSIPLRFTYPGGQPEDYLVEQGWPAWQLRVSWFGGERDQCWGAYNDDWRTNMAVAYFEPEKQYTVRPGDTLYMVVSSELYNPDIDGILDTLYLRLGPNYPDTALSIPLWARYDSLRGLAPKPEGASMWNLLLRELSDEQLFVGEIWNSTSWTNWGSRYQHLRSWHFGIYPVISFDPDYQPPLLPNYDSLPPTPNTESLRWGHQGFSLPYPNPAVDCINLTLNSPAPTGADFILHTLEGRAIRTWYRRLSAGSEKVTLDLGGEVAPGAYLLSVRTAFGAASFRIFVVR